LSLLDFFLLPNRLLESLTAIDQVLSSINQRLTQMSDQLTALTEQVEANATVTGSAITLLQGLKQQLDDAIASSDPDALADLSERLGSQTQALADAVSANTPAA
jgi:DNA-binding FadR family transcriptional regulator